MRQDHHELLARLYNWKFETALLIASKITDLPPDALEVITYLSEQYSNCGWNEGKVYEPARHLANYAALLLGYKWDDQKDFWVEK